jgi:hypothetical protein
MRKLDSSFESAQAVLARVDYLRKQGTLSESDQDLLAIIEGIGASALILAVVGKEIPENVVACSLQAAEAARKRADKAFDIVDEIVTVADAQLVTLLPQAPKFQVPKRSSNSGGGGAMSLSMSFSRPDPYEEAVDDAAPRVVASFDLVEFALTAATSPIKADSGAGKFFAHLIANRPKSAAKVKDTVASAFRSTEQ